jgi:hypothetical protein
MRSITDESEGVQVRTVEVLAEQAQVDVKFISDYIFASISGVSFTHSVAEYLIGTTIWAIKQACYFSKKDIPNVDQFELYVRHAITEMQVPMRTLIPTLVYLYRARPQGKLKDRPLHRMFAGALVLASKVHSPSISEHLQCADCVSRSLPAVSDIRKKSGSSAFATTTSLKWRR